MLKKNDKGYYESSLLTSVNIEHAFSSRELGDMRIEANRRKFLTVYGLDDYSLVMPQQVHGDVISAVNDTSEKEISGADGLVYRKQGNQKIALGVVTADCVPILAADPKARIIGAAHAGWRGTLNNISRHLIEAMHELGADSKNILVSIGPHIGACCYNVTKERADKFIDQFENDAKAISFWDDGWHLDLGYMNFLQLIKSGIPQKNIYVALACTSCQHDKWFSYRKDTKESFGEMLSFISI